MFQVEVLVPERDEVLVRIYATTRNWVGLCPLASPFFVRIFYRAPAPKAEDPGMELAGEDANPSTR